MTTAHFIMRYLICVVSIFIGSSVIYVDIQMGIITAFFGSPILSTYSLNFENQCLIFIRKIVYQSMIHFRFNESYIHFYLVLLLLL